MRLLFKAFLGGILLTTAIVADVKVAVPATSGVAPITGNVSDTTVSSFDSTTRLRSAITDTTADGVAVTKPDPVYNPAGTKQVHRPAATPERTSIRKIKLIKREYNYRQQVVLAVGMMAFIAIMMSTAQSWNPK